MSNNYPWTTSAIENGTTVYGVGLGAQAPAPAAQSDAESAIDALESMPNPGPGRAILLTRLSNTLIEGTQIAAASGGTPPQFTSICVAVLRYLSNPV